VNIIRLYLNVVQVLESIVKIENKLIQRRNRSFLMNLHMYEYIVLKIDNIFEILQDSIVCVEEEITQENI